MIKKVFAKISASAAAIDWKLLVFLLLFLNVKLVVKVAAIILIYLLRADFKFGFRLKNSRLPLFYILIIGIAVFNWLISGMISNTNYSVALLTGLFFWALCILAIHQVKLSVERNDAVIIHRTIFCFFIINAIASLVVYAGIIIETGHINPYRYQGNFQKYFMGTGDYIKGITMDTSTTNAVLNAFAVIYFLLLTKNAPALLCMIVVLLTGSNITNLLLLGVLLYIFIFRSDRDQKSLIVVFLSMLVVFLVQVSPENNKYLTKAWDKIFSGRNAVATAGSSDNDNSSLLPGDKLKQQIAHRYLDSINIAMADKPRDAVVLSVNIKLTAKPVVPKDSIHTPSFQHLNDTTAIQRNLLGFIEEKRAEMPIAAQKKEMPRLPGKLIALQQTFAYFKTHPLKLLTGTGIGNFSSKLAFRATAMNISGGYPARFGYINEDFKRNHLDLYSYYFTNSNELHSLVHNPNSTWDQLISEYGIAGSLAFIFLYLGYFTKHLKNLTYGLPLLLLMAGLFFVEYWFEQLSVVIFWELLLLLNIKENAGQRQKTVNK